MTNERITGGCLCGQIRYCLTASPTHSTMCHCVDCRRATGAQSVAWVTVPLEHFKLVQGAPKTFHSSPGVHRTFCENCGTSLTYRHEEHSSGMDITTGSLDAPEQFPPTKDIFCRDRVAWVVATTGDVRE